jgi:hypothetical protein
LKNILASGQTLFRIFHLALLLLAGSVAASPSQSADSPRQSADSPSQSADSPRQSADSPGQPEASEAVTRASEAEEAGFVCKCGAKVENYFLNLAMLSIDSDHDYWLDFSQFESCLSYNFFF